MYAAFHIFHPMASEGCDGPEALRHAIGLNCPMGADVRHPIMMNLHEIIGFVAEGPGRDVAIHPCIANLS